MTNLDKRTWAEISLDNLEHNYREIRKKLPEGCRFAGLCKANAYGHGAVRTARRLEEIGAEYLAVSCYEEAAQLREGGIELPILMLAPSPAFLASEIARIGAEQALGDIDCARAMNAELSGTGHTLRAHLKLETGMGRTGFAVDAPETASELAELLSMPNIEVIGVFTHFAVSDEMGDPFTETQFKKFTEAVDKLENDTGKSLGIRHCANSGAVVNYPWMALDMVRPGLLLYGLYPAAEKGGLDLRPVMELKTRVCEVTRHKKGDTVSYGRIFTCDRDMTIAVVPIGYADGLHRVLSGKMEVLLNGRRTKQVGRICMDMCMLDVTEMPGVRVGDVATVFGAGISADEQAAKAGTISYELLCAVSPRVPRVYI
ncbi:MAG: alanine racemase [Clostridia bacterium]|nr:alanine racemase [Clostridia bacterium]